ncbi:MAG: aspartate aminotransferase family protein [Pseudomonadota bacterium]
MNQVASSVPDPLAADSSHLDAYWMPFTANRDFKKAPRIITGAQGHHYTTDTGEQVYDLFAGLWTCGIGHCHPKIVEAVQTQVAELDYAIGFQVSNRRAFELAKRVTDMAPEGINHCFFTNSGSESVETALKIALAYHRAKGEGQRTRLIGRERGYHGVNFGGISVGGMVANRNAFSANLIPGVDHIRTTIDLEHTAFSRGQPEWGAHLADDLERLCALHGGGNIAAVIVEPVAGSTGVLPPPVGYLERLREICDRHGILLIFDEVITAFGRLGAPFAAERFGVTPDIITTAKGITNGVIPMGGVLVQEKIYDAFMQGAESAIELFHGYTYSGHPIAAAAGIACMDVYEDEGLFEQARELEAPFQDLLHSFAAHDKVIDVRNMGLMGAIELAPREGAPGARGLEVHKRCFWDEKVVVRNGMDVLQFSPFLNAQQDDLERAFDGVRRVIDAIE